MLVEVDRLAWSLLPDGYEPLELSPLCPLGTNSTIASVSQNKVVSTSRNTEVVADSTNVMALECATRRRRLRQTAGRRHEPVRLATSQRLTRAQVFTGPRMWAHFRVLALCAAGRDEGSLKFETTQLVEQIAFHVRILQDVARLGRPLRDIRVAVTDLTDGRLTDTLDAQLLRPLSARFPDVVWVRSGSNGRPRLLRRRLLHGLRDRTRRRRAGHGGRRLHELDAPSPQRSERAARDQRDQRRAPVPAGAPGLTAGGAAAPPACETMRGRSHT